MVAGSPDRYPMEYYDRESGTFEGVIPRLLSRFAEETGYDIQYYDPGTEDQRSQLARNRQVDLISACSTDDEFRHTQDEPVEILTIERGGETVTWQLWVTEVAPSGLAEELSEFMAGVGEEVTAGLLVDVSESRAPAPRWHEPVMAGLGIAVVLLAAVIGLLVRVYLRQRRRSEHDRETDPLTGLGNERYLQRRYLSVISEENRVLYTAAYFHVDTERLESVRGQEERDELLRRTASTLRQYAGEHDLPARVADTGFLLLRRTSGEEELQQWLTLVLASLEEVCEAVRLCRVSAGVYPLQTQDWALSEVIARSGQAAREAAREDKPYLVYTSAMRSRLQDEKRFCAELARGIERGEFLLYIQFYVDAHSRDIAGGEALVRWQHPEKGFLTPHRFIPAFECADVIDQLDYYMLERSAAFLDHLARHAQSAFFLSCNISCRTFADADFPNRCQKILEQYRFSRELLILELTGDFHSYEKQVTQNARKIQTLGLRVILDDFGKDLGALAVLADFPADGVKLNRRLVEGVKTPRGEALLSSVVRIGHDLDLAVLASGVESRSQADSLQRLHCDAMQGYEFFRPLPEWEARRQLFETGERSGAGV